MSEITDNNFSRDDYSTRIQRLRAIQGNIGTHYPEFNPPPEIIAWSNDCNDSFSKVTLEKDYWKSDARANYFDLEIKVSGMINEYQILRNIAKSVYHDMPDIIKDFGFDKVFPSSKNDRIARVDLVLETNERLLAKGFSLLLPAEFITRLETAKTEYIAALQTQDEFNSKARHSISAYKKHFDKDTQMLHLLKAWWYGIKGKSTAGIGYFGMVNPAKRGRKRKHSTQIEEETIAENV